jgi:hypothetical protein
VSRTIRQHRFGSQAAKGSAWVGPRDDIRKSIASYDKEGFETASFRVNFGMIGQADAERSMAPFAREVMPHLRN